MYMSYLDRYNDLKNDNLLDGDKFKWKLHLSKMNQFEYTKTTTIFCGKFRFDIEYHSKGKILYVFCRYDNNKKDFTNATNKTVTLQHLRIEGNTNQDVYHAIREWKNRFLLEIEEIG